MAHELIGTVTATPTGPVTLGHGATLDITGSFELNGPPLGSPTGSNYTLSWQRVGLGVTIASQFPAVAGVAYTKTIPAAYLPIGVHEFRVQGIYVNDAGEADSFQLVDSNLISVTVTRAREIEADMEGRELVAGLPSREAEAEVPSREVVSGMPSREIDAELPSRTLTTGMP